MKSFLPILLAAALVAPAAASAQTVAADPAARQVTALGGTIVWVSGRSPARLMQRSPDGTVAPVTGTTELAAYRNPDLGRDAGNRLVLTYSRCTTLTRCTYVRDDLAGRTTRFKGLALKNCTVSSTPAVWGKRVAYGLGCFKRVDGKRVSDFARTGLYFKKGSGKPRLLKSPRLVKKNGSHSVTDVDLRGSRVAAFYSDIWEYVAVKTISGRNLKVTEAAVSEGESDQSAAGLTLGTGDTMLWWLRYGSHTGDPAYSLVERVGANGCQGRQGLDAAPGPEPYYDYPYVDLTADGGVLYAVDPGVGIVVHEYKADFGC